MSNFGLYSESGGRRVTIVDGMSWAGRYAPDGSINIAASDGSGIYHACGAYNYTAAEDMTTFGRYAPDGSLYVSFTLGTFGLYAPNGALRVDAGVPSWTPSDLFALSQPGIWLDGSDNSVMWQDVTGITPVESLGDPVGLVLDKRLWQGKAYEQVMTDQPELLPDSFASGTWTINDGVSSITSGTLHLLSTSITQGAAITSANGSPYQTNKSFEVTLTIFDYVKGGVRVWVGDGRYSPVFTANGEYKFKAILGADLTLRVYGGTTDNDLKCRISVKEIPGNHASQSSSSSRPVWQEDDLGARGLLFDGVNDSLVTPAIDFSASDKVMAAAGVRKLSDANIAMLAELSADLGSNNGSFYLSAPVSAAAANYTFNSKGSAAAQASYTDASVAAPTSNVLVGLGDIGGDISRLRVDGGQVAENTNDQGSGNFGNYPLYIGRRGGSTLPYNGFIRQFVIRGGAWPDTAELAQLEAYLD